MTWEDDGGEAAALNASINALQRVAGLMDRGESMAIRDAYLDQRRGGDAYAYIQALSKLVDRLTADQAHSLGLQEVETRRVIEEDARKQKMREHVEAQRRSQHNQRKSFKPTRSKLCQCADPKCPCSGHVGPVCDKVGATILYRIDMEDRTGSLFCNDCAGDAWESQVFTSARRV